MFKVGKLFRQERERNNKKLEELKSQKNLNNIEAQLKSIKIESDQVIFIRCNDLCKEQMENIKQTIKLVLDDKDFKIGVIFLPKDSKIDCFQLNDKP